MVFQLQHVDVHMLGELVYGPLGVLGEDGKLDGWVYGALWVLHGVGYMLGGLVHGGGGCKLHVRVFW